jgi:hypothetical protein
MQLLIAFLVVAAVAGQFTRSFTWRTYTLVAGASLLLSGAFYFSTGLWS